MICMWIAISNTLIYFPSRECLNDQGEPCQVMRPGESVISCDLTWSTTWRSSFGLLPALLLGWFFGSIFTFVTWGWWSAQHKIRSVHIDHMIARLLCADECKVGAQISLCQKTVKQLYQCVKSTWRHESWTGQPFFHVEGYYLPHLDFFKEEATPSTLDLTWITLAQVIKHIGTTWKQLVRKTKKWSKEIAISSNSPNMITWDCSQTDRSSMDPRCPRWLTPSHDRPCPQRGAASHVKVHPGRQKVGSSWNMLTIWKTTTVHNFQAMEVKWGW